MARRSRRGQAFAELAIMGTVALAALAFLIQLGLGMGHSQELEMENFRAAMATSKRYLFSPPIAVHYSQYRDRQIPDVEQGFGIQPRQLTSSEASITWADHLYATADDDRESMPLTVISVNGVRRDFREEDFEFSPPGPLITKVNRQMNSNGVVTQPNATSSSTATNTNQSTTVTLKDGSQVTGAVASNVNWNW